MRNYIDHITITVRNAEQSLAFYGKLLHDWNMVKEDGWGYFTPPAGDFLFSLSESRDHSIQDNTFDRNRTGLDHFAFHVDTIDELKEMETRLRSEGIEMEDGGITDDDYGGTAIFCTDPDGMKVEFSLKR